ncbi:MULTISPECIES: AI-2E family transporter [Bacillus]|jgi:predicted PurR-regulated permease PerM|uniref:AI-2E family transporter n=1 Tax=Bacillus TaxID=1386 RepID=UPI0022E35DD0|nr:AI-2E family transporter [Bacillus smithii]MED0659353.1 AI-2E family transporter [Bacillus smithii]MED1419928.1 AI-2E family transporter [Bacillus smithii]MED1455331.1 AI-2E family transporter [Bacillus smithii]MED1488631.1 AI-2E family transporter [Bacillus smithii]
MEDYVKRFANSKTWRRIVILAIIVFFLYIVRSMMNVILLTFIFTFLMDRLEKMVSGFIRINRKITVILLYTIVVGLLLYGIVRYLPVIVAEITQLVKQITEFYTRPQHNVILNYLVDFLKEKQISSYLQQGVTFLLKYFTDISKIVLQVLLAIILSLFFLLEKERLIRFTRKFKHSKLSMFYDEIEFFGRKFVRTFGKVIEAQVVIAIVNTILSIAGLWIMGFPQLFGLAIMILFLGFIPVAGMIISLIPLSIIAYSIGGYIKVLYVLIMIAVVHAVEAYLLNPKLMSSKTNLPVFYTFMVLIFSEQFFGVWGLILGIPIFVFLLDVLEVTDSSDNKEKE